jgi:hypothetical protein
MPLKKLIKSPIERKRYTVDYDEWLDVGETLATTTFTVSPSSADILQIDAYAIATDGRSVAIFISHGDSAVTYTVDVKATTNTGQVKEDTIIVAVRDAT